MGIKRISWQQAYQTAIAVTLVLGLLMVHFVKTQHFTLLIKAEPLLYGLCVCTFLWLAVAIGSSYATRSKDAVLMLFLWFLHLFHCVFIVRQDTRSVMLPVQVYGDVTFLPKIVTILFNAHSDAVKCYHKVVFSFIRHHHCCYYYLVFFCSIWCVCHWHDSSLLLSGKANIKASTDVRLIHCGLTLSHTHALSVK